MTGVKTMSPEWCDLMDGFHSAASAARSVLEQEIESSGRYPRIDERMAITARSQVVPPLWEAAALHVTAVARDDGRVRTARRLEGVVPLDPMVRSVVLRQDRETVGYSVIVTGAEAEVEREGTTRTVRLPAGWGPVSIEYDGVSRDAYRSRVQGFPPAGSHTYWLIVRARELHLTVDLSAEPPPQWQAPAVWQRLGNGRVDAVQLTHAARSYRWAADGAVGRLVLVEPVVGLGYSLTWVEGMR